VPCICRELTLRELFPLSQSDGPVTGRHNLEQRKKSSGCGGEKKPMSRFLTELSTELLGTEKKESEQLLELSKLLYLRSVKKQGSGGRFPHIANPI